MTTRRMQDEVALWKDQMSPEAFAALTARAAEDEHYKTSHQALEKLADLVGLPAGTPIATDVYAMVEYAWREHLAYQAAHRKLAALLRAADQACLPPVFDTTAAHMDQDVYDAVVAQQAESERVAEGKRLLEGELAETKLLLASVEQRRDQAAQTAAQKHNLLLRWMRQAVIIGQQLHLQLSHEDLELPEVVSAMLQLGLNALRREQLGEAVDHKDLAEVIRTALTNTVLAHMVLIPADDHKRQLDSQRRLLDDFTSSQLRLTEAEDWAMAARLRIAEWQSLVQGIAARLGYRINTAHLDEPATLAGDMLMSLDAALSVSERVNATLPAVKRLARLLDVAWDDAASSPDDLGPAINRLRREAADGRYASASHAEFRRSVGAELGLTGTFSDRDVLSQLEDLLARDRMHEQVVAAERSAAGVWKWALLAAFHVIVGETTPDPTDARARDMADTIVAAYRELAGIRDQLLDHNRRLLGSNVSQSLFERAREEYRLVFPDKIQPDLVEDVLLELRREVTGLRMKLEDMREALRRDQSAQLIAPKAGHGEGAFTFVRLTSGGQVEYSLDDVDAIEESAEAWQLAHEAVVNVVNHMIKCTECHDRHDRATYCQEFDRLREAHTALHREAKSAGNITPPAFHLRNQIKHLEGQLSVLGDQAAHQLGWTREHVERRPCGCEAVYRAYDQAEGFVEIGCVGHTQAALIVGRLRASHMLQATALDNARVYDEHIETCDQCVILLCARGNAAQREKDDSRAYAYDPARQAARLEAGPGSASDLRARVGELESWMSKALDLLHLIPGGDFKSKREWLAAQLQARYMDSHLFAFATLLERHLPGFESHRQQHSDVLHDLLRDRAAQLAEVDDGIIKAEPDYVLSLCLDAGLASFMYLRDHNFLPEPEAPPAAPGFQSRAGFQSGFQAPPVTIPVEEHNVKLTPEGYDQLHDGMAVLDASAVGLAGIQGVDPDALCQCGRARREHATSPPYRCAASECPGFLRFISAELKDTGTLRAVTEEMVRHASSEPHIREEASDE